MSTEHKNTVIFESGAFSISEFRCSCDCTHQKREEAAPAHEIVFPQKGFFQRRNSSGVTQADPTRVVFFNKNQPYEIEHPLGGGDICTVFSVKPSILKELMKASRQDQGFPETQPFRRNHQNISLATSLKHHTLLRGGLSISRENILGFEEAVLEFLRSLFDRKNFPVPGLRPANKKTTREAHKDLSKRTILYLNKNFCRNFTITSLANEVFSSPFHLCRVFRDEAGMTLHSYIAGLRLGTALKALREKNISLTELALDLGYSSHSHFSSSFRRAFSLSPKEYRNH